MSFQKENPYNSDIYLDYIKGLDCAVTGCNKLCDNVAHHIKTGGMGIKCSDLLTAPMCAIHHTELHSMGVYTFGRKYKVNMYQEVVRAWEPYLVKLLEYTEAQSEYLRQLEKDNKAMSAKIEKLSKVKG